MESQQTTHRDQSLDNVEQLPSGFFPSPENNSPTFSSPTAAGANENTSYTKKHHRVVVIAYDHSNYGDAMIAKAIRLNLLRTSDDIRILHIVSQTDYKTLFTPMLSASGTSGLSDRKSESNIMEDAADAMMWQIIGSLKKLGVIYLFRQKRHGVELKLMPLYLLVQSCILGRFKR